LRSRVAVHKTASHRFADGQLSRYVLNYPGLAGIETGTRHELADTERWQIPLAIGDQRLREVFINPPFVVSSMRIETDGHQSAICVQDSPCFTKECGRRS